MCGIVGLLGPKNCVDVILQGLSRLEYRGYDSAGICVVDKAGTLKIFKKEGKLENLKSLLEKEQPYSEVGIGHTRWATHGKVSTDNAHPHGNEHLAIVHNGIIENANELREALKKENFTFKSETDSEVFLVLLTKFYLETKNLLSATAKAFSLLRGNSAFVIMPKVGNEILAVKRGAPLVCGINEGKSEVYVSSDPYALAGYAEELFFPHDEIICHLQRGKAPSLKFYDLQLNLSQNAQKRPQVMGVEATDKGPYEHFMLKEIHEQPRLARQLVGHYLSGDGKKQLESLATMKVERFYIVACGTAWHAGLVIRNFIESFCRIPVLVELASEFRYREPILRNTDVGLFISQSGETADTLAGQELCKRQGIKTISIVNVEGSTLYRNCDHNLKIFAGIEIGVASTKAFTQQVITGFLLAKALEKKLSDEKLHLEIQLLADRIDGLLADKEKIQNIAIKNYMYKGFIFTGRGVYFPMALEGALKLKEIAYVHAEGYASGELKHGPIALIDDQMVNVALVGPELYEKTISNVEEVKARRGKIVGVGAISDTQLQQLSDDFFGLDVKDLPNLAPLLFNVFNQMFSYYVAKFKGTDIDKPRNLAKSVTVE